MTLVLNGGECLASCHVIFIFAEETTVTHWIGPQFQPGCKGEEKILALYKCNHIFVKNLRHLIYKFK